MTGLLYAMGSPPPAGESQPPPGGIMGAFFPFLLMMGVFIFLIILPQRRKQKEREEMLARLQKGDRVLTTGGIYGNIAGIKENIVVVKVAEGVKLEFSKRAIVQVVKETSPDKTKK
jgi:preprotein translocase subunit YajC